MAQFIGTVKEFHDYIGPRIRNRIQTITRRAKEEQNHTCAMCEAQNVVLDAAHIHGKDRKTIIDSCLENYLNKQTNNVEIHLQHIENEIVKKHYPLNEAFLFICKTCHKSYDNAIKKKKSKEICNIIQKTKKNNFSSQNKEVLPIELIPNDPDKFKALILKTKKAEIKIEYSIGEPQRITWIANKLSENSNIIANIRGKTKFRSGQWQKAGIIKITVITG